MHSRFDELGLFTNDGSGGRCAFPYRYNNGARVSLYANSVNRSVSKPLVTKAVEFACRSLTPL